jgi:hypothetical protein
VVLFANKYARATQNMQNASRTWSGFYWDSTGVYLDMTVIMVMPMYCVVCGYPDIPIIYIYIYVIFYSVLSGI